jgi:UDPglucose 6-dehydrogenase
MRLCVLGTGYVGLVSGSCLAELGHEVTCVDRNPAVIEALRQGSTPIYEPGLEPLIQRATEAGRLHFTTDAATALAQAEAVIIAVGTPPRPEDGQADLTYVFGAAEEIARYAAPRALVITKSTVPLGTNRALQEWLHATRPDLLIASNPEFLREGSAIEDFMQPERLVIGTSAADAKARMEQLYAPLLQSGVPLVATDLETAEMIKYAANSFLATKVAFINEMADICEGVGADIGMVSHGIGLDSRIGRKFLNPGPGFGGSCFPKDTLALIQIARLNHVPSPVIDAVVGSNETRKRRMVEKIRQACGGDLNGKTLAVLGITFKPGTDDVRESPALVIVPGLLEAGATVRVHDPEGRKHGEAALPSAVQWQENVEQAARGADAVVILTEWPEYGELPLAQLKGWLKQPVLIDLRNMFSPTEARDASLHYVSVGRP